MYLCFPVSKYSKYGVSFCNAPASVSVVAVAKPGVAEPTPYRSKTLKCLQSLKKYLGLKYKSKAKSYTRRSYKR